MSRQLLLLIAWPGCLVLADQVLKSLLATSWLNTRANTHFVIFGTITLLLLFYFMYALRSSSLLTTHYSLLTIIAGGLSNLSDRIIFGGVRDIFWLYNAAFNLADVYIVGGSLCLLLIIVRTYFQYLSGRSSHGSIHENQP